MASPFMSIKVKYEVLAEKKKIAKLKAKGLMSVKK